MNTQSRPIRPSSQTLFTSPLNPRDCTIWQTLGEHKWQPSDITADFYQTFIKVSDDIKICVEAGGNPTHPPLLLIMGLGSQLLFWPDAFIKDLVKAGFFVVRFDNRDIGLSTKIDNHKQLKINQIKLLTKVQLGLSNQNEAALYTVTDMAEDTHQLIRLLNLTAAHGKVNVLGASMGGIIAQILAAKYPQIINKLILLFTTTNAGFLLPPKPRQLAVLFKKPPTNNESDVIKQGLNFIKTVGSPGFVDVTHTVKKVKQHFKRSHHPIGTVQQLNAILATGNIRAYSKKIKAPTLILHGSEDGLMPLNHGKDIYKSIPNAKMVIIKGFAHDLADYYLPFLTDQIANHVFER